MMPRAALSFALLGYVAALVLEEKPIAKVVNLLKDMQSELEKEQSADEDMYDAFSCWCEANDKGKGKAIADAEAKTSDLTSSIEQLTAKSAQLKSDIASLKSQIADNEESLETETELRAKDATEFHNGEMDSVQAIGNLKAAVQALSKVHDGALAQETMLQVRQVLQRVHGSAAFQQLGHADQATHGAALTSLLQASATTKSRASAPQSGAIFGIMKQMKESFETNLEKSRSDEEADIAGFEDMKKAKTEEITAGNSMVASKTAELAAADESNAQSKEDLEDTTAQLEADRAFLADVKARCATMDKEWAVRTKVRQDEMSAVGEALQILTDDDARDLMAKTTFLQTSLQSSVSVRTRVKKVLTGLAARTGNRQLALLAASAQDDPFAKIKESISTMITQLKQQQKDEVEKKDWCRDEQHKNEMETMSTEETKEDLVAKVESMGTLKQRLADEIAAAKSEIAETNVELKRAAENRQKANSAFQMAVSDQRATQEILNKALGKLQAFYSKKAALMQTASASENPLVGAPPPATFQPYKKKGGAGGVIGMIETIIDESVQVEKEARSAEQEEQAGYEQFVGDSAKEIASLQQLITDKQEQLGSADGDAVRAKEDLSSTMDDLENLAKRKAELHDECGYLVENFTTRQEARAQEIEALTSAKQMMSQ